MNGYLVRALIALLLAIFLFVQARAAAAQPHRRRAFWLGAAALLMLAAYNGALAIDETTGPLQIGLAIAGVSLFAGAVVSLVLSFSSGELRGERARIATAAREFREQREQQARKREP
jgi:hypothetical protein